MRTKGVNRRVILGIALSLITFTACCVAAVTHSDNQRWLDALHGGHRSADFQTALKLINQQRPTDRKVDECTACHTPRRWIVSLLIGPRPVGTGTCRVCHTAQPPDAAGSNSSKNVYGVSWLGKRNHRPAHWGVLPVDQTSLRGVPGSTDRRIRCAACHPDHSLSRNSEPTDWEPHRNSTQTDLLDEREVTPLIDVDDPTATPRVQRYRFTQICAGCHLPQQPSPQATRVLKAFLIGHTGSSGFDPAISDDTAKSIQSAADNSPLPAAVQTKFVDEVLHELSFQKPGSNKRPWEQESHRGCTPGCHSEHTAASYDLSDDKYQPIPPGT